MQSFIQALSGLMVGALVVILSIFFWPLAVAFVAFIVVTTLNDINRNVERIARSLENKPPGTQS